MSGSMWSTILAVRLVTQMPSAVVAMRNGPARWIWFRPRSVGPVFLGVGPAVTAAAMESFVMTTAATMSSRRATRAASTATIRFVFVWSGGRSCLPGVLGRPGDRALCGTVGVGAWPVCSGGAGVDGGVLGWSLSGPNTVLVGAGASSGAVDTGGYRAVASTCAWISARVLSSVLRSRPVSKSKRLGLSSRAWRRTSFLRLSGRALGRGMLAPSTRTRDDPDIAGQGGLDLHPHEIGRIIEAALPVLAR